MGNIWNMCLETWRAYWGEAGHIFLFLLGLLYLMVRKKERGKRNILVVYPFIVIVIFFFPVTADVIANYCIGQSVYWRMLWLLPVPLVIAYVCTKLCTAIKNTGLQMMLAAVFLGVIVLSGAQVYVKDNYHRADNREKISYDVKALADLIRADAGDKRKKLSAPDYIATYIRIYAPDIQMPYGRSSRGAVRETGKQLHLLLDQEWAEPAQVAELARRAHCNYLVVKGADEVMDQKYGMYGYSLMGTIDQYHLYRRVKQ